MSRRASKPTGKSPDVYRAFDLLAERSRQAAQKAEQAALENKPRTAFTAITEAAIYASAARAILGDETTEQFEHYAAYTYAREADLRAEFEEALAYSDLLEIGERAYAGLAGPADEAVRHLAHLDVRI